MTNRPPDQRPEWWPEGEAWPPTKRRAGPPAFLRRLPLIALAFFVLIVILSVVSGFFFADRGRGGPPPFVGLFLLAIVGAAFFFANRVARRFGNPIGAVMSGLDQLAAGDYTARVEPSGPPPMRALAEALNTTAARLETAEEQRRRLMADIAHDVRTPLSSIRGTTEGILDGVYRPDPDRLSSILGEVETITRLVDDMSTLSSAEAGVLRLHREVTDVGELLGAVATSFQSQAASKDIELQVETAGSLAVDLDPQRIRQVLENLVTNALRYTARSGSVRLAAREEGTAVIISVADTGSGIAPSELPHIFERYRKGTESTGSGLGLAIARRLVEAHGGTITATSNVGSGTTVSFSVRP